MLLPLLAFHHKLKLEPSIAMEYGLELILSTKSALKYGASEPFKIHVDLVRAHA